MPEATEKFAIPFPCVQDDITLVSLQNFAQGIESAISTVNDLATLALQPPMVWLGRVATQNIAAGATSTVSFDTEVFDRGAMFTIGSPTLITLPNTGSYSASLRLIRDAGTGNVFSFRGAILLAGAEIAYNKDESVTSNSNAGTLTVVAFIQATAGQTVTATTIFTGTGTMNIEANLQVTYLSTT